MAINSEIFIDKIAESCLNSYKKLPKNGKTNTNEWTVLSCIVKYVYNSIEDIEVVSLGTGSKCIGASKMSSKGDILNDSHAEVIARRGFMLYIYENIKKTYEGKSSIFSIYNGKCTLDKSLKFAFFSSQLPCGDASIIPKIESENEVGDIITDHNLSKRHANDEVCPSKPKLMKISADASDIHRTGAKCLLDSPQDPQHPGKDYHLLGQVRTKPGRGERTLSVSCSDKIARWIHTGIQGALLDLLLTESIYVSQFIFGSGVPYSEESVTRAFLDRDYLKAKEEIRKFSTTISLPFVPQFYQCSLKFPNIRSENKMKPAPTSIVWINTPKPILEISVIGKKLGTTNKNSNSLSSQVCISKRSLYKCFLEVLTLNDPLKQNLLGDKKVSEIPYHVMKKKSKRYNHKWTDVKQHFFKTWTTKGDLWNFCIDSC